MYNYDFGRRLEEARNRKALSKEEVANLSHISVHEYYQIENGNAKKFELKEIVALSKTLECSVDYLLTGDDFYRVVGKVKEL